MKKAIREMLEGKPEAKMDPEFEKELKERLLAAFSAERKARVLPFFARPAFFIPAGTAAAACLVALLSIPLVLSRPGLPDAAGQLLPIEQPIVAIADGTPEANAIEGRNEAKAAPAEVSGKVTGAPTAADAPAAAVTAVVARPLVKTKASSAPKAALRFEAEYDDLGGRALVREGKRLAEAKPESAGRDFNTEAYDRITENAFRKTHAEPLSTFSIDVDTASYANVRRYLEGGELPPPDAVRIEELVNYFPYSYAEPSGDAPLAWNTELAPCPWNADHYLLRIGLQAKRIPAKELPPSNLVFLLDVSGSMEAENKLPLVKESMRLLVKNLREQDRISIVVYSGAAGLVLEPTAGDEKDVIMSAIDNLEAGGSTAGGEGIELAYKTAKEGFQPRGNNRVILATDGDFNVGASSDAAMERLIEEKRKTGIFLTVLGFGMGNYKDSKMQKLADTGNGNYAYVDSLQEARKVLEKQMAGTLYTLAKDVKIQIEFNPAKVARYRLIGYEKRILAAEDFEDDAKDAGELGAGHSVTALYEIVAAEGEAATRSDLRYQSTSVTPAAASGDLMTIRFRYKKPDGQTSRLLETAVPWIVAERPSADFRFAAAVAQWGLLLRNSEHKGSASYAKVLDLATGAIAASGDPDGYRKAFIGLVEKSRELAKE